MSETEQYVIMDAHGRCKCCLSERELKAIWNEHEFEGEYENYGEMLNECFGISWQPSDTPELICEMCVSRLREAIEFKREIIATQELLEEGVNINLKTEKDEDNADINLNMEQDDRSLQDYDNVEFLENDDDDDDDYTPEDVPSSSQGSTPEPRKRKYPPKKIRSERNKTYKQYSRNDLLEACQLVWSGQKSCAEAARQCGVPPGTVLAKVNESSLDTKKVSETKEANNEKHYKLIEEIHMLLKYTNAIPFKTRAIRYYCFYCSTDGPIFEDADDLRNHTNTVHCDEGIAGLEQHMKPIWVNEVIKFDIQDLHCTECRTLLPDWNYMFVHFAECHNIGFDQAYSKVIPYALTSDLSCTLCQESFHNFGLLDAHMNLHYSNHICYKCGDTFLSTSRLDKHLIIHKTGNFPCKMCDKVFTLEKYMTKHFSLVHEPKCSTKCLYCKEKFLGPIQRHVHVTEKHKEKVKTLTCEVCGKLFTWKPYFLAHMRRRHNAEKKYQCQYCPKQFLMQYELKTHLVKHSLERVFVCGECGETCKSVTAMKKHIVQSHKKNNK